MIAEEYIAYLEQIVDGRGTLEVEIMEGNGQTVYFYKVHVDETLIRDVMISFFEAGIYVSPGLYHENAMEGILYVLIGDIDMDDEITAKDYMVLKRHVLQTYSLEKIMLPVADIDQDGEVDAMDYMALKRHVLGTYQITGQVNIWANSMVE